MTDILLDEIAVGQTLREAVCDRKGNILLREGVALTRRHIALLLAQGVQQVNVLTDSSDRTANPETMLSIEQATAMVEQQFHNTDSEHPLIMELKRICALRRQLNPLKGK